MLFTIVALSHDRRLTRSTATLEVCKDANDKWARVSENMVSTLLMFTLMNHDKTAQA